MRDGFESVGEVVARWQRERGSRDNCPCIPVPAPRAPRGPLSPAGLRQKRSRARRRNGRVLVKVEVDEFRLIDALQAAGRLRGDEGLQRAAVEREAAALVADFVRRWTG
jgi:hypothetical protein